jgi:site-specific DNA-methyltransferase (adenine-specific)
LIGTVAANVLQHGTGAINIDGCRVSISENDPESYMRGERSIHAKRAASASNSVSLPPATLSRSVNGRWPANIIHDGSDEVVGAFPETDGGGDIHRRSSPKTSGVYGAFAGDDDRWSGYAAAGTAARFFYTAKADADDRIGSKHPTVKPVDLMQWLVRLVTPKGGLVLDPFAGTGTTGEAAYREGMSAILIEREDEYQNDIRRRMKLVLSGPDEKRRESLKSRGLVDDAGPLFGGR